MATLSDTEWKKLKDKLRKDGRFEKFVLGESEREYVTSRGMDILRLHATDFVNKRLASANPNNSGRQTPTKGHPVFIAQHAMGCNDREGLMAYYDIPMNEPLTKEQEEMIVELILRWIEENLDA